MGLLGKAVEKPPRKLIPIGEYVWTLWDMMLDNGQYGEQIKWVWLISPVSDPDNYILRDDGQQEKEVWQFSKTSLARGSKAWIWSEALLGRALRIDEEPDDSDLIRRRMIAMLVHKGKRADPNDKNEAISDEIPPRPFRAAQPAARSQPPAASEDEVEAQLQASDELRARFKKLVRNAELEEVPGWETWAELNVSNLADADIRSFEADIRKAMREALAA